MKAAALATVGFVAADASVASDYYCLTNDDLQIDFGTNEQFPTGVTMHGNSRLYTKSQFDMSAGGSLDFELDIKDAKPGVNNGLYMTFPPAGTKYCDSELHCANYGCCAEFDILENDGNCYGVTTWHTPRDGSDHNGQIKAGHYLQDFNKGHTEWSADGNTVTALINGGSSTGWASGDGLADVMRANGAKIYVTMWSGWAPCPGKFPPSSLLNNCTGCENDKATPEVLASSSLTIKNIAIKGTVVQGSEPPRCKWEQLPETLRKKLSSNSTLVV